MNKQKILVINGSPQNNASGTLHVTKAFLQGVEKAMPSEIEILNIAEMNIKNCMGCLSCWGRTEGQCVIKDDSEIVKEKIIAADVVIASFPLYFFGMPGIVKNLTDRLLCMQMAYKGEKPIEGQPYHEPRYDMSKKKFLLISTCGYGQIGSIYNSLLTQLDCIFGKNNYYALLCPQGRIFSTPELNERSNIYLEKYTDAGIEFAKTGELTTKTLEHLQIPMFTDRRFELLINKFWTNEKNAGLVQRNKENV